MRRKKKSHGSSERWLLTYSDLITLLMILFILLYAMSNVNQEKYEQLSGSLNESLGNGTRIGEGKGSILPGKGSVLSDGNQVIDAADENTEATAETTTEDAAADTSKQTDGQTTERTQQDEMEDLKYSIDNIISKYSLEKDVGIIIQESEIIISFSNNLFFDSGKATLKEDMKEGLRQIAIEMNKIDNSILVKGFTDNIPVSDGIYSSNWQLSAIRAANVVQYLIEKGKVDGSRLSAVGCGENQPVADNDTVEGRSQNRRIEIIILYNIEAEK